MSSFNEAMTQIRELEERAIEELKEIVQVGSWPWHIHPSTGPPLCSAPLPECDLGFASTGLQVDLARGSPLPSHSSILYLFTYPFF